MIYTIPKRTKPKGQKEDLVIGDIGLSSLEEAGWKEKDLENLLASKPELLFKENKLLPVFQETQYQEHPDIIALDSAGVLYIFELKRQDGNEDSLLQVIRYGQLFGRSTYDDLQGMLNKQLNVPFFALDIYHQQYFALEKRLEKASFNNDQRFVVVTAGVDTSTLDAIEYWQEKKMPIQALTYHVYKKGNEFLLEFHSFSPTPDDYAVVLSGYYFVNSNSRYDADGWKHMIDNKRVSAYGGRRNTINAIGRGDTVFLYHTGVGAIAYGKVQSAMKKAALDGIGDEEHYVDVAWKVHVDPTTQANLAVSALEINKKFKARHTFRQTRYGVSKAMAEFVSDQLDANQKKTKASQ